MADELAKCPVCGRLFNKKPNSLCHNVVHLRGYITALEFIVNQVKGMQEGGGADPYAVRRAIRELDG